MLKALTYANKKTYSKTASGTSLMCMIKIRVPRYFLVEYQIPLGEDKNDYFFLLVMKALNQDQSSQLML